MDSKPNESKTIKTIVPIRGNLLEKIKNKLKHNGSPSQSSDVNDAVNNNKETLKVVKVPASHKKETKIEIQKVEKVNLELSALINSCKSEARKSADSLIIKEAKTNPVEPTPIICNNSTKEQVPNDFQQATVDPPSDLPKDDATVINCKESKTSLNPGPETSTMPSENLETDSKEKKVDDIKETEAINSNEMSEEEEEGECMDIGNEDWLNDISVMIGESRIKEIDQSLKKIPVTVTGNKIQTENVELKLIINHLLDKLKAKSVIETVEKPSSTFLHDSKDAFNDYSDSFDDMPTDFSGEDSNTTPAETSTSMSVNQTSSFKDTFSVALENSVAVVSIPTVQDIQKGDETKANSDATLENQVNNVKKTSSKVDFKTTAEDPPKKRRGHPIAASTAKKPKPAGNSIKKEETIQANHPRKLSLRGSSRESSIESTHSKETKSPMKTAEISKYSPSESLRSSSRDSLLKTAITKDSSTKKQQPKKVTRVQELSKRETESSIAKKGEKSESSSEHESDGKKSNQKWTKKKSADLSHKITSYFKKETISPEAVVIADVPPVESVNNKKKLNGKAKTRQKRKIITSTDSDSDSESLARLKNSELKSTQNDSNSQKTPSSIIERYDYLNKSSTDEKKKKKSSLSDFPICDELKTAMEKSKKSDPTYIKPPDVVKRPYLITSAFTGNQTANSDDSSHILDSNEQPSVSRDDSSLINSSAENTCMDFKDSKIGIKNIMKDLISKQKQKIEMCQLKIEIPTSTESTPSVSPRTGRISKKKHSQDKSKIPRKPPTPRTPRIKVKEDLVDKAVFKQEPLENADEELVCYSDIIEAIRITVPPRVNGKAVSSSRQFDSKKKAELQKKLTALGHFKCGNCNYLVTKHKWKDHIMTHGGLAWLDGFESPIDINDWNESVRRLINNMRIYKLEFFACPNCKHEKRSALGHLSHVYTCGEEEATIESRKWTCQSCSERILPYNMSAHRQKCKILNKEVKQEINLNGDDEEDDDDDETSKSSSVTNKSGRGKRKAGKKAQKKFKTFLEKLKEDPMDHVVVTANGYLCNHCNQQFDTKDKSIEHYENSHADKTDGQDFEASSSDANISENESSETDGSSGVESSDVQSADEEDFDLCDSNIVSNPKGKQTSYDSEEVKCSRKLVASYIDSLPHTKVSNRTIKLTKQFYDNNLCDNILVKYPSKYKIIDNYDLASCLMDLDLPVHSLKFTTNVTDFYSTNFRTTTKPVWNTLEVGKSASESNSLTIFCGGSVSSVDWSQMKGDKQFLAIACNSTKEKFGNLDHTSKTCIQVYQFERLFNDKFSSFNNVSNLLYFFTVSEGPVWSIKFHPFVVPTQDKIGLLAVTSSNHHVYIYSLPYIDHQSNPFTISLEPLLTCKTSDEFWLFQDKYLMQSTLVSWFFRKSHEMHLLAAGFINGMVSVWNIEEPKDHQQSATIFPYLTFQPHHEPITALDFKHMLNENIYLLTASLDRVIKVFLIDSTAAQEISSDYTASRVLCAEWWLNWAGFICGNDTCYAHGSGLIQKQPLEFATKNLYLFYCTNSITNCTVNNWLNVAVFTTDSGDVLSSNPSQPIHATPRDKWSTYANNILSYTDVVDLDPGDTHELGIVFNDLKSRVQKRPKDLRTPSSTDNINQLQINQISFNRNEQSYRFYALAYETGFVRVRHLKNAK